MNMQKSIGACVLMASLALGNKVEKGKSTLEIQWENGKGEKKSFTINDIEKAFNADQIKGQTFLQEGLQTIGKMEVENKEERCGWKRSKSKCSFKGRGRSGSRSGSLECSEGGRYKYPHSASKSKSHSRSKSRSHSKSHWHKADDFGRKGKGCEIYREEGRGDYFKKMRGNSCDDAYKAGNKYEDFAPYEREGGKMRLGRSDSFRRGEGEGILKCKAGKWGKGKYGKYAKSKYGKYGKYGRYGKYGKLSSKERSFSGEGLARAGSRRRSRSQKNVFTMSHKPRYDMRGWDVGCENPKIDIIQPIHRYDRNARDQGYLNHRRNAERKATNLDRINRNLMLEKARRNQIQAAAQNSRNNQNAKATKKYLNKNNKININHANVENCSAAMADNGKNANKFNANLANKKNLMRRHSLDAKHSHNLMNIKDRCKEGLCMNEMDNDNLRADEKVIEEFDKLEHYKKVNECNRSAEKNNNCLVKKRNDVNKNAKQMNKAGQKGKRRHGIQEYSDSNKRDAFDYNDYDIRQKNEKKFNDRKECLKDDTLTKACSDDASNENSCEDANSCCKNQMDYINGVAKQNGIGYKRRGYDYDDNVCALNDQNLCNDEIGSPCYDY